MTCHVSSRPHSSMICLRFRNATLRKDVIMKAASQSAKFANMFINSPSFAFSHFFVHIDQHQHHVSSSSLRRGSQLTVIFDSEFSVGSNPFQLRIQGRIPCNSINPLDGSTLIYLPNIVSMIVLVKAVDNSTSRSLYMGLYGVCLALHSAVCPFN